MTRSRFALALLPLLLLPLAAFAVPPPPKILVIDRSAILRGSKAGQDIVVRSRPLPTGQERPAGHAALRAEGGPCSSSWRSWRRVKAKKIAAFEAKQALQGAAQKKQG